jgi:hypothetical protein
LQIYYPIIIVPTFLCKNYEKHTEGVPRGRGLAAPESEFNSQTYALATANIVTFLLRRKKRTEYKN